MSNIFEQADSDDSAKQNIFQEADSSYGKPEGSNIGRGFKESFQQLPQLGYGLVAGTGAALESAVGEGGIATGIKKAGVKGYQEWGDKIAKDSKESDSITYSYDRAKEGDFGAMVDWVAHGFGYAGGQGAQMLATAGLGSIVGKAGLKVVAEKIASGMVAKEAARLAEAEGANIAADQLTRQAVSNVAGKLGETAAIGSMAFGQEGGEIFGDLSSQSDKENRSLSGAELARAFGATLAAGGMEFVGDKLGIDLMLGKSPLLKPASGMAGMKGRVARGTIAAAGAAPIEGATEYGQTLLEEYGKGNDPFSAESLHQAKEAAALGVLGGNTMGFVGGAMHSAPHVTIDDIMDKNKSIDESIAATQAMIDAPIAIAPDLRRSSYENQDAIDAITRAAEQGAATIPQAGTILTPDQFAQQDQLAAAQTTAAPVDIALPEPSAAPQPLQSVTSSLLDAQLAARRKRDSGQLLTSIETAMADTPLSEQNPGAKIITESTPRSRMQATPQENANATQIPAADLSAIDERTGRVEAGAPVLADAAPGRAIDAQLPAAQSGYPGIAAPAVGTDVSAASTTADRQPSLTGLQSNVARIREMRAQRLAAAEPKAIPAAPEESQTVGRYTKAEAAYTFADRMNDEDAQNRYTVAERGSDKFSWFVVQKEPKSSAAKPQTVEPMPATDRRTDMARRRAVAEMNPDEMRQALLTSDLTGLPNKRAFEEHVQTNPKEHVLYGDLDDFKSLNTKYGHEGADQILRGVGAIKAELAKRMGISAYHRSGDEFLATDVDDAKLNSYGKALQESLAGATFEITKPDGTVVQHNNVGFSYGTGKDVKLAESQSDEQKAERKRLGLRVGTRSDVPVAESGRQADQDNASGRDRDSDVEEKVIKTAKPEPVKQPVKKEKQAAALKKEPAQANGGDDEELLGNVNDDGRNLSDEEKFFAKVTLDFLRDSGFSDHITDDGNVRLYHGTSAKNAASITTSGKFKGFPFFSPDRSIAEKFSRQAGKKTEVIELVVDPSAVLPTGGYISARAEGLSRGGDDVWRYPRKDSDLLGKQSAPSTAAPFDQSLYDDIGAGKSSTDILNRIAAESDNELNREMAQALIDAGVTPKITQETATGKRFTIGNAPQGYSFAAAYSPKTDTVMLFDPDGAEQNAIHELVHSATYKAIRKGGINAMQMNRLYKHVQESGKAGDAYGMSNLDEFTAEALSNPEFQDVLRSITKMPEGSKFANAWEWFVDLVRRTLNLPRKYTSALDQALSYGRGLMEENGDQTKSKSFNKWFGDSKVVDENGDPLVMYHGTSAVFDAFDNAKTGQYDDGLFSRGHYFTGDRSIAKKHGKEIIDAYLSIKNPYIVRDVEVDWRNDKWDNGSRSGSDLAGLLEKRGYDGVIWQWGDGAKDIDAMALHPEQIKSATGNNGKFDPNEESILGNVNRDQSTVGGMFDALKSAQTLDDFTKALKSQAESDRTFNLWDRTVATQFQKSTKDADYKRVFDAYNQQTNDVAHYAIEAERQAPDVLQRLESVKDIGKALMSGGKRHRADLEAVSKALFANIEGKEGVQQKVFTDEELKNDFKLNAKQILMYKQARQAVNTSLDRLAQTTIASMGESAGMDIDSLRNMDLATTAEAVKDHVGKDSAIYDNVDEVVNHATELKEAGYMPAMRFGEYAVTVWDKDNKGKPLDFKMFESQLAANLAAKRMEKKYPNAKVEKSVMNKEMFAMFKGVSPETVELFAKYSGMDKTAAYKDYIALAKSSRSSLQRLHERGGIAGFSDDLPRVLASFLTSNARQASMNMNMGQINESLASDSLAKKGDVQREAQKLHEYMSNPQEEAQRLRGFLFMHFLGGSVASAAVNLTQPVLQTAPYLSQFAGTRTVGIMTRAAKMAATGNITGNESLKKASQRAAEEGLTEPQEIHQLMADASGSTLGSSLRARALTKAWGGFFSVSEAFNRRLTFLAAYQTAQQMSKAELQKAGFDNAYDFSARAIIETQGLYAKQNRPNWARGPVGSVLFTFKQFSISYIEFLNRLPKKQKAVALGMLVLAAGLQGLPFAEDIEDLIDTLGQSLGYNTNSKKALRDMVKDTFGDDLGDVLTYGLSAKSGIDLHGRLGTSNLIPGTGLFKMSNKDKSRDMAEFGGALGGVLTQFQTAFGKAQTGDVFGKSGALASMAPVAIKNALQGAEMAQTGEYRDTRGRKVQDVDLIDSLVKSLGFQPQEIAAESRRISAIQQDKGMMDAVKAAITERWADGIAEKNQEAVQKAREALTDWNEKNPDTIIIVRPSTILARVRDMRLSREERYIKSVPKSMRARVRSELDD